MSKNVFLGLIKVDKDRQIYDHPFVDFIKDKNQKIRVWLLSHLFIITDSIFTLNFVFKS